MIIIHFFISVEHNIVTISPRVMFASTSSRSPRSIILPTAFFAAAPCRPFGSGMASPSARAAAIVFAFGLLQFQFAVRQRHQVASHGNQLLGRAAGAGLKVSDFFTVLADDQA